MTRFPVNPRSLAALGVLILLHFTFFPGIFSSGIVTLDSIEIFRTHEWLGPKPIVYFQCHGENKTFLPDVKKAHLVYAFKGEESWQPLTELADKKCKRCGFYEKDTFKSDDVFEEWEFCPSDFTKSDGKYVRFKEKEFNATFLCPKCVSLTGSGQDSDSHEVSKGKKTNVGLVLVIMALVVAVSIFGGVVAYRYWQRKKREHDQARFLKLFEDSDDIEDDLGLGSMI